MPAVAVIARRLSPAAAAVGMALAVRRLTQSGVALTTIASRALKFVALLVVFLNARSWPILWHIRVFRPLIYLDARVFCLRASSAFKSARARSAIEERWWETLSPLGRKPFDEITTYNTWAGPDDCDFNIHLSNSCYAKTLDAVRFKFALVSFPAFFRSGGRMLLGGTHWDFIREIPALSRYEVRCGIAGWDGKWMYLIARYVTKPKKSSKKDKPTTLALEDADQQAQTTGPVLAAYLPSPPTTTAPTPARTRSPGPSAPSAAPAASSATTTRARVAARPEADGATVHCVAVSAMCFKLGRLTVPPAVVLACDGFGTAPQIPRGVKVLREVFKGGWRDAGAAYPGEDVEAVRAAEGERWWETALGGDIERRRVQGYAAVAGLVEGTEGARGVAVGLL
ncbi:hypothetical protein SCP_1005470 [Sparassis crispa]|uniref:Thioesterase/thiol ester dehydrase-isomerase n=1 Tax=Sparassis crispa TaxID=139825 RepID=A0A401GYR8_9APHY|nr:hypothetical protein SCP_1005470 [Sparassis crispa]GBE87299.1 hypothetical protein SCP_1005470 [Sparassis crispa]